MTRPFVLLDRDGTIVVERHYLSDPDQLDLIPGVAAGLRQLQDMGLGLVVVTNQSGVGRGLFDQARLDLIHRRLRSMLQGEDVHLDGIFYCPHTPEEACRCRKPEAGLVEQAAGTLGFDPTASFVVGDKPCDVDLGKRVGATTFLVRTGYGAQLEVANSTTADYVVDGLWELPAVLEHLLAQRRG